MSQGPPQNNDIVRLIEQIRRTNMIGGPIHIRSIPLLNIPLLNTGHLVNMAQEESFEEENDLPKPMCKKFIKDLQKTKITSGSDLSCAICQEKFKEGETVIELPCKDGKHSFHFEEGECLGLKPWIEINNTCPVCRTEYPLEPEPEPESESEPEPEPEPESEPEPEPEQRIELPENILEETFTNLIRDYIDRTFDELEERDLNEALQRSLNES